MISETGQFEPRPVFARFLRRMSYYDDVDLPTEEEKADAILVLRDLYPPVLKMDEVLLREAELIMIAADESGITTLYD